MINWHFNLFSALVLLTSVSVAWGDTFYLSSGGRLKGELLNSEESPRERYEVKTESGGRLTLDDDQVERVVVKSDLERRYEEMLPKLADTGAAHWDMAERCRVAGLREPREFHLHQVMRHDPDHAEARHALDYSFVEGRWIRQDQWMVEQGYIRDRGTWRLPQEIEIARVAEQREDQIVEWRKKLKTWRGWLVKGRDNRHAGEQQIRAVRDPNAVSALADMLDNDKEHRQLKLLYIDVLGQIGSGEAANALIQHALNDADRQIRDACIDRLDKLKSAAAVQICVDALAHKKNFMVVRAAVALGSFKDPAATLPLINALITEHKEMVGGGGGIRPSFSSNGGGGLSVGGKPKVKKVNRKNEPVLHALSAMHQGVNFGYNQAAWKNWFIKHHTPPPVDLRRER